MKILSLFFILICAFTFTSCRLKSPLNHTPPPKTQMVVRPTFSALQKVLIRKNIFPNLAHYKPSGLLDPSDPLHLTLDSDAFFTGNEIIEMDLPLVVLVSNECRTYQKHKSNEVIKKIILINESEFKPRMKLQAYAAALRQPVTVNQLNDLFQYDACIIGLTKNDTVESVSYFNDLHFSKQHHHAVLKTEVAYLNYFTWLSSQGPKVKVAVVDSGIDIDHPDLVQNIWTHPDGSRIVNFSNDKINEDSAGHGTHVAGLIAASGNNNGGVVGIMQEGASLMAIKVLNSQGKGNVSSIVNGILYAIDNNADVINLSVGGNSPNELYAEVIRRAYAKNIPIISAAGNDNNLVSPFVQSIAGFGESPGVIVVGSINAHDLSKSKFSNYGDMVDISAPGSYETDPMNGWSCVVSTLPTYASILGKASENIEDSFGPIVNYGTACGTSMAAPQVTGAIALIIKHLKLYNLPYSSDFIEKILLKYAQFSRAKNLGTNLVIDLQRLSLELPKIKNLDLENQSLNLQSLEKNYLDQSFVNYFFSQQNFSSDYNKLLKKFKEKSISLFALNNFFVTDPEYVKSQITSRDLRISFNIIGRKLSFDEAKIYLWSISKNAEDSVSTSQMISSLLLTEESLAYLKEHQLLGYPIFDEDLNKDPETIKSQFIKRVQATTAFRKKLGRSPRAHELDVLLNPLNETKDSETLVKMMLSSRSRS